MIEYLKQKLNQLLAEANRELRETAPFHDSDIACCVGVISSYEKVLKLLEEVKQ